MALYTVSAGSTILAADLNQYRNLLTGVMTDQLMTLGFVGANSSRLIIGNVALALSRGSSSTSSTGLMLASTSGGTVNQGIMLVPGSEDLVFAQDNGSVLTEYFRLKSNPFLGTWFTSTVAAAPSAASYGGGLRLSLYGSPITDTAAFGFGIAANELWANVNTGSHHALRVNGATVLQMDGTTGLYVYNGSSALKYVFRTDNSGIDPGSPWFRTDGSILAINPRVGADLYLMWDSSATAGVTHIGQNSGTTVKVGEGAGTLVAGPTTLGATSVTTLSASGASSLQALTTSGAVTHNSVGRLVFSGATTFTGGVTATSTYLGITMNGTNYWIALNT